MAAESACNKLRELEEEVKEKEAIIRDRDKELEHMRGERTSLEAALQKASAKRMWREAISSAKIFFLEQDRDNARARIEELEGSGTKIAPH